jgi:hypothetical protein
MFCLTNGPGAKNYGLKSLETVSQNTSFLLFFGGWGMGLEFELRALHLQSTLYHLSSSFSPF